MAQPSPFRPAEMGLRTSEVALNQQGMSRTSAPMGPQLYENGTVSSTSVNPQPYEFISPSTEYTAEYPSCI